MPLYNDVPPHEYVDPLGDQVWVVPTGEHGPTPLTYKGSIIRVPPRDPKVEVVTVPQALPPPPRQVAPQGMVWQCGYVPLEEAKERPNGPSRPAQVTEAMAAARGVPLRSGAPDDPQTAGTARTPAEQPPAPPANSNSPPPANPAPAEIPAAVIQAQQAAAEVAPAHNPALGRHSVTVRFGNGFQGVSQQVADVGPKLWQSLHLDRCYAVVGHAGPMAPNPLALAQVRTDATAAALRDQGIRIVITQSIVEPASTPKARWAELRRTDVYETTCPILVRP